MKYSPGQEFDDDGCCGDSGHKTHKPLWDCEEPLPVKKTAPAKAEHCEPQKLYTPFKEYVKTYKCYYKLYKVSHYELHKVCPRCGQEFNYHYCQGMCPYCY